MSVVNAVIAAAMAAPARAWVASRRHAALLAGGRGITSSEHDALRWHFSPHLLNELHIAPVDEIRIPLATPWKRVADMPGRARSVPGTVAAICLWDTIIVRKDELEMPTWHELLFHETVHAAQWWRLGRSGFLRAYFKGWLDAGRVYHDIPLEREAREFTEGWKRGEQFRVASERP